MRQGTRSVGADRGFGRSAAVLEDTVQGLDVAGAFGRQLVGHAALGVGGKGSSSLADLLGFAFQIFIQHVAAEGRQVLL